MMALSEGKNMNARIVVTHYVSLALLAIAGIASGEAPIFQITQLYSNADGSVQFIELAETGGSGGWQRFAGLTLTMTHYLSASEGLGRHSPRGPLGPFQ
jgi:hypothetical protein